MNKERPTWQRYALDIAKVVASRSPDIYKKVGCCLLRHDMSVAACGYNGPISGYELDFSDRDARRPYIVHSESNALRYVRPGECKICAVTISPCSSCIVQLGAYGIKEVVYEEIYKRDELAFTIAKEFRIEMIQLTKELIGECHVCLGSGQQTSDGGLYLISCLQCGGTGKGI